MKWCFLLVILVVIQINEVADDHVDTDQSAPSWRLRLQLRANYLEESLPFFTWLTFSFPISLRVDELPIRKRYLKISCESSVSYRRKLQLAGKLSLKRVYNWVVERLISSATAKLNTNIMLLHHYLSLFPYVKLSLILWSTECADFKRTYEVCSNFFWNKLSCGRQWILMSITFWR